MAKKRLNLELSEETYNKILALAEKNDTTMTNIIRQGVVLRSFAEDTKDDNKELAVIKDDEIEAKLIAF